MKTVACGLALSVSALAPLCAPAQFTLDADTSNLVQSTGQSWWFDPDNSGNAIAVTNLNGSPLATGILDGWAWTQYSFLRNTNGTVSEVPNAEKKVGQANYAAAGAADVYYDSVVGTTNTANKDVGLLETTRDFNINLGTTVTVTRGGVMFHNNGHKLGRGTGTGTAAIRSGLASGELAFIGNGANNYTVDVAVVNGAATSTKVIKDGNDHMAVVLAGTYSGGTYINRGRYNQAIANAYGSGPVYVSTSNAQAYVSAGNIANNFSIGGLGWAENAGQLGALRVESLTVSGNIAAYTNARIGAYNTATPTITGNLSGPGEIEFWNRLDLGNYNLITLSPTSGNAAAPMRLTGRTHLRFTSASAWPTNTLVIGEGGRVQAATNTALPPALLTLPQGAAVVGYNLDPGAANMANLSALVTTNSDGAFLLPANSTNDFDLTAYPNLALGAAGNFTNSGTITPASTFYRLGGGFIHGYANGNSGLTVTNLTGPRDLRIEEPGMVTLGAGNDYQGNTYVGSNAWIGLTNDYLGQVPVSLVTNNLTFDFGVFRNLNASFLTLPATRGLVFEQGGAEFHVWGAGQVTVAGPITGPGRLLKSDAGTLILSNDNTFAGGILVTAGVLRAGSAQAFPPSTGLRMVGGTLQLNGYPWTVTNIAGAGTIQNGAGSGAATLILDIPTDVTNTFNAALQNGSTGALTVVKTGGGVLNYQGAATHTGWLIVSNGQFRANGAATLQNVTTMVVSVENGGRFTINKLNLVGNHGVFMNNRYIVNPGGVLELEGDCENRVGPIVLNGGSIYLNGGDGGNNWGAFYIPETVTVAGVVSSVISNNTAFFDSTLRLGAATVFDVANVTGDASVDLDVLAPLGNIAGGGVGSFTKQGGGTMLLSGTHRFTGTASVSNGTLAIGAVAVVTNTSLFNLGPAGTLDVSASGSFALATNQTIAGWGTVTGTTYILDGAGLRPGGVGTPGTLSFNGNLTLTGGALPVFDLGSATNAGGGYNDLIAVTGDYEPIGSTVSINAIQPLSTGTYRLVTYTGAKTSTHNATVNHTTRYSLTLDESVPGEINLTVGGTNGGLRWESVADQNWNLNSAANWFDQTTLASAQTFFDGDTVLFDDTAGVQQSILLAGTLRPVSVTVATDTNSFTIGGIGRVSGATGLLKTGTNTLLLATTNDFIGTVNVQAGTLKIGANSGALGSILGGTHIDAGATLDFNGLGVGQEPLYVAGTVLNTGADQQNAAQYITLTSNATFRGSARWDIRAGVAPFLDLAGFTLTKTDANYIPLVSAACTNAGDIVVNQGTLAFSVNTIVSGTGSITVNSGGTLAPGTWGGTAFSVTKPIVLNGGVLMSDTGGGATTVASPITLNAGVTNVINTPNANLTLTGPISGAGFSKLLGGTNTLTLSGNNSFTGNISVATGGLTLASSGAIGSCTNILHEGVLAGGGGPHRITLAGGISLGAGAAIIFTNQASPQTRSLLTTGGGSNVWNGSVHEMGGGILEIYPGAASEFLVLAGGVYNPTGNVYFRGSAGTGVIATACVMGTDRSFTKTDAGTWILATTNTQWGYTLIAVGTVRTFADRALPPGATLQIGQTDAAATTLDLAGTTQQVARLFMLGTGTKLIGNSSGAADAKLIVSSTQTSFWGHVITDGVLGGTTRKTALTVDGGHTMIVSNNQTFTGPTLISNASVRLLGSGSLYNNGNSTGVIEIAAGGDLRIDRNDPFGNHLALPNASLLVQSGGVARIYATFATIRNPALAGGDLLVGGGANANFPAFQIKGTVTVTGDATSRIAYASALSNAFGQIQLGNNTTGGVTTFDVANGAAALDLLVEPQFIDGRAPASPYPQVLCGLTKTGAGVMAITATNRYSGPTVVGQGTLLVQGGLWTGAVQVAAGATLGGTGLVGGTVTSEGTVAPGASAGTLTIGQTYNETTGSVLAIELGGNVSGVTHDLLTVSNAANLAGALNVTLIDGFTPATNDVFLIVDANTVSGTFSSTVLPALGAGQGWEVQYLPGEVMLSITSAPVASGYDLAALVITNGLSGYNDDADGDGYANLLEYATGGSLTNPGTQARMNGGRTNGVLALKFTRDSTATDATIYVEGSYTATNGADWVGIATNLAGSWGGSTNVTEDVSSPINVTVQDNESAATNRFLRLRITRP